LKKWDGATDTNSRGAVLFARWYDKINADMFRRPWDPSDPVATPCGLKDTGKAVRLLAEAAREVIKEYDSLNVAWGDVYRFRIGHFNYPANGGSEKYGIYRTIYFSGDSSGRQWAVAGDSYVAITEFGRRVKARVLLSYGNASEPGSKHMGDQLQLLSRKEMRIAWLSKKEIKMNLEQVEKF